MTHCRERWDGATIDGKTVCCMATFPDRFADIPEVVASLAGQVDWLFIYVNNGTSGFPSLPRWDNVVVLDSQRHAGDLSANGKIYPLKYLANCFVITADDDFIYPGDYVRRLTGLIEAFGRRCCATVHGAIFPPQVRWYYERQKTFAATRALGSTQLVTLAGSGTFAFHQSTLQVDPNDFLEDVMVDLKLSLAAKSQRVPIWSLSRPEQWLRQIGGEGLWQKFLVGMTHHTEEARRHDWSFSKYREIALEACAYAGRAPSDAELDIDPGLLAALRTGEPPEVWRNSLQRYLRRADYMKLLAGSETDK